MIKSVHENLVKWGLAVRGGIAAVGYKCPLAGMVATGSVGWAEQAERPLWDAAVDATDVAVRALPGPLYAIVEAYYVYDRPLAKVAGQCGCSERTAYRRLDQAHEALFAVARAAYVKRQLSTMAKNQR